MAGAHANLDDGDREFANLAIEEARQVISQQDGNAPILMPRACFKNRFGLTSGTYV